MLNEKLLSKNPFYPQFYENNPLYATSDGSDNYHYAAKTNRQLIADCYAGGGQPVVTAGGQFIACSRKMGGMNSTLGSDGFYNVTGGAGADVACALAHPFNKTARKQCEEAASGKQQGKQSKTQSEADLNAAIAQGIMNKANQPAPQTDNKKVLLFGAIGVTVFVGVIFIAAKLAKKNG